MNYLKYIIIHHIGGTDLNPSFDTSNQSFEVVNEYHRQKWDFKSAFGFYLGYQYFIDKYGKVTQARRDDETGAHTIGQNNSSIGICLAGNFDVTLPTPEQVEALKVLVISLKDKYNIRLENIVPHRHFAKKTCFGTLLSDDWLVKLLTPVHSVAVPCASEKDIIKQQEETISNLQKFIRSIINLLTKQL